MEKIYSPMQVNWLYNPVVPTRMVCATESVPER